MKLSLFPTAQYNAALPKKLFISMADYLTGMHGLNDIYQQALQIQNGEKEHDFYSALLHTMRINVSGNELDKIPLAGGAIIACNHPFGGAEGIALGALIANRRKDFKIMANTLLSRIPEFESSMIFVNPFGNAVRQNIQGIRKSIEWVQSGGILGIFPAGSVSHYQPSQGIITDAEWHSTLGYIIRLTQAPVIPLYFHGHNSATFQAAGLVHPYLRTAMLPAEFLGMKDRTIEYTIGNAISPARLLAMENDKARTEYIRSRTYFLSSHAYLQERKKDKLHQKPVENPWPIDALISETEALPGECIILENKEFTVYCISAPQAPVIIREIGRLRELTFRAAGEGTGKASDLDEYDARYLHLFLWHKEKKKIAGAYRLGLTDKIMEVQGKKGLYIHSLFRCKKSFLESISPGIELGRSFIIPEFQRNYQSLLLLWKGIAAFICKNPHYRYLFGPVSISNDYTPLARQLMVLYLRTWCFHPEFSRFVKPREKYKTKKLRSIYGNLIYQGKIEACAEKFSELISEIEPDGKGIPVLLRQYLKLNGKIIGFNVDKSFSDVIDGFILVDLINTPLPLLMRYMGTIEAQNYLEFHQDSVDAAVH
jgi:putative hemolysin